MRCELKSSVAGALRATGFGVILGTSAALLGGCGQKGPLTLPAPPAAASAPAR